jgi:hypothetical protein
MNELSITARMEFIFLNCARARLGYPSLPCAPARITFLKNDPFLKFLNFLFCNTLFIFFLSCPAVKISTQ